MRMVAKKCYYLYRSFVIMKTCRNVRGVCKAISNRLHVHDPRFRSLQEQNSSLRPEGPQPLSEFIVAFLQAMATTGSFQIST
jgi:hypothetical protein